ncbi:unnamed protein product, partial [Prorocentrum cordatum]
ELDPILVRFLVAGRCSMALWPYGCMGAWSDSTRFPLVLWLLQPFRFLRISSRPVDPPPRVAESAMAPGGRMRAKAPAAGAGGAGPARTLSSNPKDFAGVPNAFGPRGFVARYTDLLDKARDGLRALERNYTSNTEEAGQILRCLSGGCGKPGDISIEHEGETEVMKEQQEIEDGLSGPSSPDRERPDAAPPDAVRQLDANPKKDAAAEDEEGILERLKNMVFGYEDDKAIGQPVHEDGTPLAPGENPTNATVAADVAGASGKEARAKAAEEAGATGESTTASGPAEGSSSKTSPGSQEGGVISTVSEQANETEESPYDHAGDAHEVDPGCQDEFTKLSAAIRQHFVGFAKGRGACQYRAMVPESAPESEDREQHDLARVRAGRRGEHDLGGRPQEGQRCDRKHQHGQRHGGGGWNGLGQAREKRIDPVDARGGSAPRRHGEHGLGQLRGRQRGSRTATQRRSRPRRRALGRGARVWTPPQTSARRRRTRGEANPRSAQTGQLSKRHVPGLGGLDARGVRRGEGKTASGFAPPSTANAEEDPCTEVKYSWNSATPSATVCLPEETPR